MDRNTLHNALRILATLARHDIDAGAVTCRQAFITHICAALKKRYRALRGTFSPGIDTMDITAFLNAATALREVAADCGMRDEYDQQMDTLYTAAFALQRRKAMGKRRAA